MKKLFSEIPYIKSERLVLRKIEETDAAGLSELAHSPNVYRYLPTFLYERKYDDIQYVIRRLYDECFKDSIILGVFMEEEFCGLAEIYGYRENTHKASIGCRFLERYWGKGIATETVGALVRYLFAIDSRSFMESRRVLFLSSFLKKVPNNIKVRLKMQEEF